MPPTKKAAPRRAPTLEPEPPASERAGSPAGSGRPDTRQRELEARIARLDRELSDARAGQVAAEREAAAQSDRADAANRELVLLKERATERIRVLAGEGPWVLRIPPLAYDDPAPMRTHSFGHQGERYRVEQRNKLGRPGSTKVAQSDPRLERAVVVHTRALAERVLRGNRYIEVTPFDAVKGVKLVKVKDKEV